MLKKLSLILLVVIAIPVWSGDGPIDRVSLESSHDYSPSEIEFYLSKQDTDYIRPGLNVTVESLEVNAENRVVLLLTFKDDLDQPLDRAGKVTPGPIGISFVLAVYDGDLREYYAYTSRMSTSSITGMTAEQATSESNGTWEDLELGRARYTFATPIPSDADLTKTHTVAFYATRETTDIVGKRYYDNVEVDFRPDGGEVGAVWDAVATETCNGCHDPLALHGGRRQNTLLCVTCHSPQSTDPDTGNTVDMKVMIHKIHMGENLPSVQAGTPYQIIGFRNSVHDYSHVLYPQDVRNCETCHRPESPEGNIWYTRPTRAACGSCHDDVVWETGENHDPGPQMDDASCANCHSPEGEAEFDVSIRGAHIIETKSQQLAGLNAEIMEIIDTAPGQNPQVTFKLYNDDGSAVDPSSLDRMRFLVGGSTGDYTEFFREDGLTASFDGDTAVYRFESAMPEDATGSWVISADIYRFVNISIGMEETEVREAAFNPILYFAVTDAAPQARREIVDLDKCNACHDTLALHGGQRFAIEECVICHNPMEDDAVVRPEEELPAQSIHFKFMIHRIHTGHELTQDFTVYGFRGSVHNYNEVAYPGDRRNCEACHMPGTYGLPLPGSALPTITMRDPYTPMEPGTATCLSCHDSIDAAAHAFVNTAPFGEACSACHGDNREFSVEKSHAR